MNKTDPKYREDPGQTFKGPISISSKGVGYFQINENGEDLIIEEEDTGTAFHGDIVKIVMLPKPVENRRAGKVLEILERKRETFVGTIELDDTNKQIMVADNRRIHVHFVVEEGELKTIVGYKVLVKLLPWADPRQFPKAKIIRIIGKKGDNDVEMESIILERGFESSFPQEVEDEALKIKQKSANEMAGEITKRRDIRNTTTFTIDPDTAKDFDDAISFKEMPDGEIEIGVHIADVAHYVRPQTALDREAQKRGVSVYLVDRTIPMLPEVLSNDLCSLNPNEEKLAFSAIFTMTKNGEIRNRWFGRTVIRSDKRFTYEEAQKIIDAGEGPYAKELLTLNRLAKKMLKERSERGAISFDQDEVKFVLDENGKPLRIIRKVRLDTHKLVEEFMLLANKEVAEFVANLHKERGDKEAPIFVYRIHDLPDEEKITSLAVFLKAIGHELKIEDGMVTGQDINALFKQIEGEAEEGIVKTAAVRSMSKAIYSTKNIGHFGLAFDYYTHFTSPIRRYPDTLVHRLLAQYLDGKRISKQEFSFYEKMSSENTESEIRATEAERESVRLKQVEFMSDKIGKTFDGIISGVTNWGIYVEEKETRSEGMIKLRDLGSDYYMLDEKNYCVVGEKTGKKYSLGDAVKFKIVGADTERKTLDFVLAG